MNDNVTITVGIAEGSDFGCVVEFGDESMEFLKETKTDYYENGPVWDFTSFRYIKISGRCTVFFMIITSLIFGVKFGENRFPDSDVFYWRFSI